MKYILSFLFLFSVAYGQQKITLKPKTSNVPFNKVVGYIDSLQFSAGSIPLWALKSYGATNGQALIWSSALGRFIPQTVTASGSVTSVGLSMPTGFAVSATPITGAGTFGVTFESGYQLLTSALKAQYDYAYGQSLLSSYLLNPVAVANYDSLLWRKNDSTAYAKLIRIFAGSNKIGVTKTINDSSSAFAIDVNEANLNLANIGGTLPNNKIAQNSATSGQALKWNGSAWAPADDETGGTVADGSITNAKLATVGANTLKGNNTGSTAAPTDLSVANVKTMLSINNVDNTSDATKNSATATLSNKRITKRVQTSSSSTPTPNTDDYDEIYLTYVGAPSINAPTGTPTDGQIFTIVLGPSTTTPAWPVGPVFEVGAGPSIAASIKTYTFRYNTTETKWYQINADDAGSGAVPSGGADNSILTKQSAADGDYAWEAPSVTPTSTTIFTNKRWTARVGSTTSSATPTINTDNVDIYKLTAQTADITSFTTNLTGTPNDGDILVIQITGTAARAITWGSAFVATTIPLPTTTVTTATLNTVFIYSTSSYGTNKWHIANTY